MVGLRGGSGFRVYGLGFRGLGFRAVDDFHELFGL